MVSDSRTRWKAEGIVSQYIFGYGSLIEQASRMRTTPSAIYVLPARVHGYARGWWARTGAVGFSPTFVGATPDPSKSVNGVIYAVSDDELAASDKREEGYVRVDAAKFEPVEILSGGPAPNGEIYIYVNDFKKMPQQDSLPTAQFPIVQSYVDICLTGCLQIEKGFPGVGEFAREFIESTQEWSKYWENDRAYPRRAPFVVPKAQDIDKLLKLYLPDLFAEIQLAPGRW
jgi:cation transport regulator ChaC